MKQWTEEELIQAGYKIENALIEDVDLSMEDYSIFSLSMSISMGGTGCVYGGRKIGHGYLGAKEFIGYESGIEYLMRIMDTVGVSRFNNLKGKYIRIASKGLGSSVEIIGNIMKNQWFDQKSFFEEYLYN